MSGQPVSRYRNGDDLNPATYANLLLPLYTFWDLDRAYIDSLTVGIPNIINEVDWGLLLGYTMAAVPILVKPVGSTV